jgi:hypothetical protein
MPLESRRRGRVVKTTALLAFFAGSIAAAAACKRPDGTPAPAVVDASAVAVPSASAAAVTDTAVDAGRRGPVVDLMVGLNYACAVLADGTVRCWGKNIGGQLGDGTQIDRPSPTPVVGVTGAEALFGSDYGVCARLHGGKLACWGGAPKPPPDLEHVARVGVNGMLALLDDGTVRVLRGKYSTKEVASLVDVRALVNPCALHTDGTVTCWDPGRAPDKPLHGLANVEQLVEADGTETTCARQADGDVKCWGRNRHCMLGYANYPTGDRFQDPVPVALHDVKQLAMIGDHLCAVTRPGTIVCLGQRAHSWDLPPGGEIPCGPQRPWSVAGLEHVERVTEATGTLAILSDGSVWQFDTSEGVPTAIGGVGEVRFLAERGMACALRLDGTVVCWSPGSHPKPEIMLGLTYD